MCRSRHAGFSLVELLITSVIFSVIVGLVVRIVVRTNSIYRTQRQLIEARDNASVSLDMIVRLVRMATTIDPDPDGDGVLNRIRVEADWNPRNGVVTDPYETVTFWPDGQRLLKQEPTDAAPVVFADRIESVTFTYADTNIAHARKLILWQEWSSFDQFLQRGDGAGCSGDELEAPPIAGPPSAYPSLPIGYPTDATQFIPPAGRSFGVGGYRVQICDDNSTDVDLATGVPNTNRNADVNGRIFVRSRGLGQNGSAATIEITIGPDSMPAILVNGDLDLKGNRSCRCRCAARSR